MDEIELTGPRHGSIARDFADGTFVAQCIHYSLPNLGVQIHNYPSASSVAKKSYNWSTLQQKVFKKLKLHMSKEEVADIVGIKPGAIEKFLIRLRDAIDVYQAQSERRQSARSRSRDIEAPHHHHPSTDYGESAQDGYRTHPTQPYHDVEPTPPQAASQVQSMARSEAPRMSLEDRDRELEELKEGARLLEEKIERQQQLVRLKDSRIQVLLDQIHG